MRLKNLASNQQKRVPKISVDRKGESVIKLKKGWLNVDNSN